MATEERTWKGLTSLVRQQWWRLPARASRSFLLVRLLLSSVLLVAAVFKASAPMSESMSLAFQTGLVLFEWFLAVWLVSGLLPQQSWYAAIVCFTVFAIVAATKTLTGESNCGCFGDVHFSPRLALSIDITAILLLLSVLPVVRSLPTSRISRKSLCLAAASCGAFATLAIGGMSGMFSETQAVVPGLSARGRYLVAEPASWLGARFPLTSYIDVDAELQSGNWFVLFVRPSCEACDALLYAVQNGYSLPGKADGDQLVLISVEQTPSGIQGEMDSLSGTLTGAYSGRRTLLLKTPLAVEIHAGIVEQVVVASELF